MCSAGSASSPRGMFDVQNIYGTPQVPRKKPCLRPRRMTLIDLRNVPLTDQCVPERKASSGTVRSEGGLSHYSKSGILHIHDSTDSLPSSYRGCNRSKHISESSQDGSSRFPKLEDCAHFHYDFVDFEDLQVSVCDHERENYRHNEADQGEMTVLVRVSCNDKVWTIRRSASHFSALDRQLHRCIFDRKFSQLPDLQLASADVRNSVEVEHVLQSYVRRFSQLAGTMINCGSILNWLEMDNRGNRLLAVDDSGINTPAIAAAHAVKRYTAQAADEISLQVGDIVSVIDMPSSEDTIWWRGKRGFEVGFFPSACVEVIISDKVPSSMATIMPVTGSLTGSIHGNTLTPIATPTTARKPYEVDSTEDTASMIRKQGKLISFLRTFFNTRPPRSQLKQSGIVKERVFGCDLGEHLLNLGHDVPVVLTGCTEVIERYGIVDGIYRLSGITSNIQKLRVAFDEDEAPELMESTYLQDIHSISSLLKMYFRELPNPLLTYQLYDKFAEAVRDEENKLLRIHDVVQQLPPPHYRTLEYLMRHLARVASRSMETGMHSKNLAIVWAPNLLRSKELELGGGAAALQGVGIQAVVTECLICYCDLIFNDKMAAYDSPESQTSQKKPRPKSLAISTPTRLLSLEEARERAFLSSLAHSQRFIDVGGGPCSLPATYHTVLDLQGYRKKSGKTSSKVKKSPANSGGWKAIFRTGSVKKGRKGSLQGEEKGRDSLQARALTEEDVHNWKSRLRSAKSAESLLSLAMSTRTSVSSQALSSADYSMDGSQPADRMTQSGYQPSSTMGQQGAQPYRQSFVRGDCTRKALHRRTPSAPNTPRLEHNQSTNAGTSGCGYKASSQPQLDSLSPSPVSDRRLVAPPVDTSLGVDIDAAIKARLQKMALQSRNARSHNSLSRSAEKRRGEVEREKGNAKNGLTDGQSCSPLNGGQRSSSAEANWLASHYHDYAEIGSDDDEGEETLARSVASSDARHSVEKSDHTLSSASDHSLSGSEEATEPEAKLAKLEHSQRTNSSVARRPVEYLPAGSSSDCVVNTVVGGRKVDRTWSEGQGVGPRNKGVGLMDPAVCPAGSSADAALPPVPNVRNQRHHTPKQSSLSPCRQGSSCVPSDVTQSLENATSSQNDVLSSITLSELSQSISSFCSNAQDDFSFKDDLPWRRSTSLDSLEADSAFSQHSLDINTHSKCAFQEKVERAIRLEEKGYSRHGDKEADIFTPLHVSEGASSTVDCLQPGAAAGMSPKCPVNRTTPRHLPDSGGVHGQKTAVAPSSSALGYLHSAVMAPKQNTSDLNTSFNAHPDYADYSVIRKRQRTSKENRGPGFYSGQGVLEDSHCDSDSSLQITGGPVTAAPLVLESPQHNSSVWREESEVYADSVHSLSSASSSHTITNTVHRLTGESGSLNRMIGSSIGSPKSEASVGRSGGASNPRSDSNVSNSDFHLDHLSQSELSAGVCIVKRQSKSSSLSSDSASSSDVDDISEESVDIIHQAQPVDAHFAVKVSRKQRAAERLPPPDMLPNASSIQENSPKPSTDNALWKQSPLFDQNKDGRVADVNCGSVNAVNMRHMVEVDPVETVSAVNLARCNSVGDRTSAVKTGGHFSHQQPSHASQSDRNFTTGQVFVKGHRALSDSSDSVLDPVSPRQGKSSSASQSDSMLKVQREDMPIISGTVPVSPVSPLSPTVSPRSPTICSPSVGQPSRLPSPRSPLISYPGAHPSHIPSLRHQHVSSLPASQKSYIPSLQSPPVSSTPVSHCSPSSQPSLPGASVPLHLMLYHPDEFTIPAATVSVKHSGPGLAQIHVKSDTVTEEKAVIKKGVDTGPATDIKRCKDGSNLALAEQALQQGTRSQIASEMCQGGSESGMQLAKTEQESMEVDNLCNRLVDQLHSVHSPSGDHCWEQTRQAVSGGVQMEAVVERCVEETGEGGEAVVEQRLLRVESFGSVQEEEMENALNVGKEMLQSHWLSLAPSCVTSPGTTPTQPPAKTSNERRPSVSKIPRFHKRSDSREDKSSVVEGDPSQQSPSQRRTNTVEEKSVVSVVCKSETCQSPRSHKQGHEEKSAAPNINPAKVSQPSRFHRRTNSREEKMPASGVSQGNANQQPRLHRRTQSQEEKKNFSSENQGEAAQPSRLHRRSNCREEREPSSHAAPSSANSPKTTIASGSRASERGKTGVSPKSKDSSESSKSSPRISKIPLSQKIPSPTSNTRESKIAKSVSNSSTSRSSISGVNRGLQQSKPQPGPVPRARSSIHKSDHTAPPPEEVMEVSRPLVKKRTTLNQKGEKRPTSAVSGKESRAEKNMVAQEIKIEKGDAKLVIEKQSKKKIQTVHAQKVPHPVRQIAEALDTDTCDSSPAELSSTGPSDMEHSGMSSQEEECFSDENLRLQVGRNRSYSSGMCVGGSPFQPVFFSPRLSHKADVYQQMTASRSSLDDSALQLAAERQDDLIHDLDSAGVDYSTGSLRACRSQRMRKLMQVFEKGRGRESGEVEEGGRRRERSDSTSGSTTLSNGSQDKGLDGDDDDIFQPPPSPHFPPSLASGRSRSRDRVAVGGGRAKAPSPHRRPSQSPVARRLTSGKGEEPLRRRRPSPGGNNSVELRCQVPRRAESGVGSGRPPRYRSNSRSRTYSDSSTSESDNTLQFDSNRAVLSSPSRPRGPPRGGVGKREDAISNRLAKKEETCLDSSGGLEDEEVEHRGSFKELRQLFEKNSSSDDKDAGSDQSPPPPSRCSVRTRSVSPAGDSSSPTVTPNIMRRSLEIPGSSAMLKHRPVRLGPKPFYGVKK